MTTAGHCNKTAAVGW